MIVRLIFSFLFISCQVFAQPGLVSLSEFSSGYSKPVDIKNCGDSRLFIVQQDGYIYICDSAGNKSDTPFLDIHTKISTAGEQGLLGLAFPPDYPATRRFYIYYTAKGGSMNLTVARYHCDSTNPDLADTAGAEILMSIPHPVHTNHNGGAMQFGPDGYLYFITGDGGSGGDPDENAQNPMSYLGKMIRIDVSTDTGYAIPADNPFLNIPGTLPEIWALGLRNAWRFSYDGLTHDLWIADVGQFKWEEINFISSPDTGGQNYGWDCKEGTYDFEPLNCDAGDVLTNPAYEYEHLDSNCSVTGGYVYRGNRCSGMYGRYFFADFCTGRFWSMESDGYGGWLTGEVGDFQKFNFVSFGEDQYGELYAAAVSEGKIYRVEDSTCFPVGISGAAANGFLPSLFPNPANRNFRTELPMAAGYIKEITIFASSGKPVLQYSNLFTQIFDIDAGSLPPGLYMVKVTGSAQPYFLKLIIL